MQMKQTGVLGLLALMMVLLLAACGESHEAMLRQLEALEQMNRADSVMTNDSLAEALTNYFDSHGTANERLRAHYILGRTYADMGEAPRALDCYYDALSCADTTATDCDFRTLIGINGQMAVIFHQQNLPRDEIQAVRRYIHYMQKAYPKDTLRCLIAQRQLVRPYYLLGEKDTVLQIIERINRQLEQTGHHQEAASGLGTAIYIYTERGQFDKVRQLLTIYEHESNLFDTEGNVAKGWEDYYWIKGLYELAIEHIDSAELYFRKGIQYGSYEAASSSYKGMLSVYQHKQNLDSVVYYSRLSEIALDSLHQRMQTDAIHQASALYDYTRSEKLAEQEAQKKREAWYWFWGLLTCGLFLIGLSIRLYKKKQEEKQEEILRLTAELTVSKAERQSVKEELEKLKSKNYDDLIIEKERKEQELEHRIITLEQEIGKPKESKLENRFADFKNSQIVSVFSKKALFTKEHPLPNKAEWNALVSQFMTDMPAVYQIFFDGKTLSPLELYTCILLILDHEESVVVGLTQTSSSAVSIAKRRANQKLFKEKSATTLKYNLKRLF
jgi:tetratricopeptide (TPR) repeat protein